MPLTPAERSAIKGHRPAVLWFTGLSGSGKSTIAGRLEEELNRRYQAHTCLLDGDIIRKGLNRDLDYSEAGRRENIRRLGEVTRLFHDAGLIIIAAFISPFRSDRELARSLVPDGSFFEIFISCPLEVCENRDVKGLYRKARAGLIPDFTGISSPYEAPLHPEITLDTSTHSIEECVEFVVGHLQRASVISGKKSS